MTKQRKLTGIDFTSLKSIVTRWDDATVPLSRRDIDAIDSALVTLSEIKSRHLSDFIEQDDLGLVGESRAIRSLRATIWKLAKSTAPVLITGENGTGKERVASALVETSSRRTKPFVKINCGALAHGVLESELFGHVKGAFTGAGSAHEGVFARADGGTLFLDEIGETSLSTQVKLLRVLQEGTFVPVGGAKEQRVDVRIIAATNRDLDLMRKNGTFRDDLYFRLAVVCLSLPPLRERKEDIPRLVHAFIERERERDGTLPVRALTHELLDAFAVHQWPGNVRELENAIRRLVAFSGGSQVLHSAMLEEHKMPVIPEKDFTFDLTNGLQPLVHAFERRIIEQVLQDGSTLTEAARRLGLTLPGLRAKMERVGVEIPTDLGKAV